MRSPSQQLLRRMWMSAAILSFAVPMQALRLQPATQFSTPVLVGQQSAPLQVSVTMIATGTPTDPQAVTDGIANQEFSIIGGTCSQDLPVTSIGQQCTATVVFAPKYPGLREGAVVIRAADGTLLGSILLAGVGTGSLAVLNPGTINTVVGDSEWFWAGDGVAATNAPIHEPAGMLVDAAGNIYLSDSENYRIRRVDAQTQIITTIAGIGSPGDGSDGGPAVDAAISTPSEMAMDGAGNIYFADTGNHVIRRIGIDGILTTIAGTLQSQGYSGDGGPASAAKLSLPEGVALDSNGNLFITDTGNQVIREVDATTGTISTVAGVAGLAGFNGDGTATASRLNMPWGLAVAGDNSLYIADTHNNRIRRLSNGALTTVAGSGGQGYGGDGAPAGAATLNLPLGVALDPAGDLYIADSANDRVRKISSATGDVTTGAAIIQTVIGTGVEGFSGDAGPANAATLHGPYAVVFAQNGDFYVADTINNRIRAIKATPVTLPPFPDTKVTKASSPPFVQGLDSDGNADLNLSQPTLTNAALDPVATTCSFTSAVFKGSTCNLGIEFAPTTVQSDLQGSVALNSDAENTPVTINISGNALDVNPTTMTLTSSANPSVLNRSVTFTAGVSNDDSSPLTGAVVFLDGATTLCTASLNSGKAFCSVASLSLGQHTITANYAGDANNEANTASIAQNVRQQPTVLLLVSPSSQATVLQNLTLTLTVTPPSGTASGTVTFYDGGVALASAENLNSSGTASLSTSSLGPGQHNLSAQYSGDATNASGTSNVVNELIVQSVTTTDLSTTNATPVVGESFVLTATVTAADSAVATGPVTFFDSGSSLGTSSLDSSGKASVTVNSLSPGTHSIVARYAGDTDNATSDSSALTEAVAQIATVTTLSSDANPASAQAVVHLTAIVSLGSGATADGPLSGTMTFLDNGIGIGTANVDSSGHATLPVNSLPVGSHTLTASYGGASNYAPSNSSQLTQQIQKTSTTVDIASSAPTSLAGETVTITTTVTSGTGIPTGSATLYDGGTALQIRSLNAQGIASFSLSTLASGGHSLLISYSGDTNYSSSTSPVLTESINLAQPQITLSGPTTPVNVGIAVRLTGNIVSPGLQPTGILTLLDGSISIGSEPVSSSGGFSFSSNSLSLGTHQLSVSYGGDGNNSTATSSAIAVTVQKASTATAIGAGSNPGNFGQTTIFSATVVSDSAGATGSVKFFDGPAQIGSVSLDPNGRATFTTSALGLGLHNITATYAGDSQHASSTSTSLSERIVEPATATIATSRNPSVAGADVAFAATVIPQGGQAPTGELTFRDNGAVLGSVALDSRGSATLHTSSLSVGTHNITASYAGDVNVAAASASLSQSIQEATTDVALTASSALAIYTNPVTLTATLTTNGALATGVVIFMDEGAQLGQATINSQGTAILSLANLSPGTHTIVASYGGDGNATAAVSTEVTLVVKQSTSLSVSSSSNPSLTASPIILTATLTNDGAAPATGSIVFSDGAAQLGTAEIQEGHASLALPSLPSGTHSVAAAYAGDGKDFAAISEPISQIINLRTTTTVVTASQTSSSNPQQVTLIAVVHGDGSSMPTGTVTFTSGDLPIGSAATDANGIATLTILLESSSSKENVAASYGGDATFHSSTSASIEAAAGPATQFTLAIDPAAISLVSKQHAAVALSLASIKGFNDNIQLGCLGLPFAATCTFSSPQVKLVSNGTATVTLTVDTGDPLGIGAQAHSQPLRGRSAPLLCLFPGVVTVILFTRRRKLPALLIAIVCCALTISLSGCAGLQGNGTPPGSYTFKVTASGQGSGATQSQVVTLTVTQ